MVRGHVGPGHPGQHMADNRGAERMLGHVLAARTQKLVARARRLPEHAALEEKIRQPRQPVASVHVRHEKLPCLEQATKLSRGCSKTCECKAQKKIKTDAYS